MLVSIPSRISTLALAVLLFSACASTPRLSASEQAQLAALLPADVLLLGEQHDAPEHQQLQRSVVQWLGQRGELAALAIEMADQGRSTATLKPNASEADVRAALNWPDNAWPWASYGPVVMAAVQAGVPVLGANLPRARMREAMRDSTLDTRLSAAALTEQQRRIREGHCNSLPEAQILPMTRVQIARDIAMAGTVAQAARAGRTLLLVAGNGHVHRSLGVPVHLPTDLKQKVVVALANQAQIAPDSIASSSVAEAGADLVWPTPPRPPRDYCAEFKRRTPAQPRNGS